MPPWYQPIPVQSKSTIKLPYRKLQYPAYVKDTDLVVHIRIFKKAIRTNGEIVEWILSTYLVLFYKITSQSGVKNLYKIILIVHL
jgi:hypothetical protein